MTIQGKVAAILNERDLVINKGSEAGVKEGMRFKVVEPSLTVTDPDTQEELGSISKEKIRVRVTDVQPRFSIGKTYETYIDYVEPPLRLPLLPPPPKLPVTRVRTLRVDSTTRLEPMSEDSSFVKIGDPVVELEGDL